ncbi:MAG: LTA synthase family protein, partial [Ruminococcus sp.]|nr:LTA synthase family protein [Ruminococcus sp.]
MNQIEESKNSKVKTYISNNLLFLCFVISSVLNSFMLRVFTVGFSYNQLKPLLADVAVVLIFGMFGYIFKSKKQFGYFMFWTLVFTILTAGNSIYYTNFKSFLSISLLSTASQLGGVMDAVTENIMEPKDFLFIWPIPALIAVYIYIKKKRP